MHNPCTWQGKDQPRCNAPAPHELRDQDAQVWARLCDLHQARYDELQAQGARGILGGWIAAQGGARAAAERMAPAVQHQMARLTGQKQV